MLLHKWLKLHKLRPYHLTKAAKVCSGSVWYHINEGRPLTARVALIIEKYTKGEVTLREMVTPVKVKKEVKKEEVKFGHGVDKAS